MMYKALPKKEKDNKVKKKPVGTAGKKKAGKGGKTRYSYPKEKGGDKKTAPGRSLAPPKGAAGEEYAPPSRMPQQLGVDITKFCNQLGIAKETLVTVVKKFSKPSVNKSGFIDFMSTRCKEFCNKHGLDKSYWNRLFDVVVATTPELH